MRVGFEINIDKEFALTFLTRYGVWSERYPLPILNRDNAVTAQLSDGKHYLVGGWRTDKVPSYLPFASEVYQWARSSIDRE